MKALSPTLAGALALIVIVGATAARSMQTEEKKPLELGKFSVSFLVKDIKASKAFYEKLDFKEVSGKLEQNWIVLQNGTTTIGLFQGLIEHNQLTFNPGWTKDRETPKDFQDVRELQRTFKARGIKISNPADESTTGPASFTIADPDGNALLFDQYVASPKH
jgi:catechol 2,3-dioxygenase-like lactoylglutathione lyase family enzyme